MTRKIFISYRRDDAKAEARSIYQHLERVYGRDALFMDVDSIQKGQDFTKALGRSLKDTSVMLVVMGRTWLHQQDDQGRRRLDDPGDYVRLEVASALSRDIAVIPVRVDGARLPRVEELPDDLKGLVLRQGTSISHENFDSDLRGLEGDLRSLIEPASARGSYRRAAMAAGAATLLAASGVGLWAFTRPLTPTAPQPAATAGSGVAGDLREAAAEVLRQREVERERRESEVRRRVEEELSSEARRKAEAARAQAEAAARLQAEEDARRHIERTRLEAEADALRQAQAEQERTLQEARAKAEAAKAAAAEKARARQVEGQTAWAQAMQINTLVGYLDYLRAYRDAPNREDAKSRARPLLLKAVADQIDDRLTKHRRPDGSIPLYLTYPDNLRAAAACIDWAQSSPQLIQIRSISSSGESRGSKIERIEQEALGFCQSGRREGSNCSCQIVRRNKENTTQVPDDWLSRHLD